MSVLRKRMCGAWIEVDKEMLKIVSTKTALNSWTQLLIWQLNVMQKEQKMLLFWFCIIFVLSSILAIAVFVPTPLLGEELYTQMGFFVRTILADRYIHCREMWVASLKSQCSVEFETIKIFSNFLFFQDLSRIEILAWLFTFRVIFLQIKIIF